MVITKYIIHSAASKSEEEKTENKVNFIKLIEGRTDVKE